MLGIVLDSGDTMVHKTRHDPCFTYSDISTAKFLPQILLKEVLNFTHTKVHDLMS